VSAPLDAALALVRARVVRADELVPLRGKVPTLNGGPLANWPRHHARPRDFEHPAVSGVGLRLGRLADVDCDCGEAVELAPAFLPATFTFGRASVGRAHWLYVPTTTVVSLQVRDPHRAAKDGTKSTIVELRGVSRDGVPAQTMGPGSMHPNTGERVGVFDRRDVALVDGAALRAMVVELGIAALVRRHGEHDPEVTALAARLRGHALAPARPSPPAVRSTCGAARRASVQDRASAYVGRMAPAISGSGGQRQLWRVATALVVRFDLSVEDAIGIMRCNWNRRCAPPWSERELRRAAENVARVGWTRRGDLA
jgi:hypothetical protein